MVMVLSVFDMLSRLHLARPEWESLAWTRMLTRKFFSIGYAISVLILLFGAFCLMTDLGRPERFYYVLTHPTMSVLSFGSYVLGATVVCALVLGAISFFKLEGTPCWVLWLVEAFGALFSVGTLVYTGLLLAEIDFVFMWSNPVLPVLFALSGLSVGMALVMACLLMTNQGYQRIELMRVASLFDGVLIVLEAISLWIYVSVAALFSGPASSSMFVEFFIGRNAVEFWLGFVVCGLVAPLVLDIVYAKIKHTALLATAIPLVLIGGFYLRYCLVNVGFA